MNYLLLLAGLVLVVCLMNSKDLMKSVSSKSKSVSKSLGVDSTTLLVVVFVGAVLFMCMNKGVEGFVPVGEDEKCVTGDMHMVQLVDSKTKEPTHKAVAGCFNPEQKSALIVSPLTKPTKPKGVTEVEDVTIKNLNKGKLSPKQQIINEVNMAGKQI